MALWAGFPKMNTSRVAVDHFRSTLFGRHFWAWFASLESTTVLRSVLVCLNPLWVGLWEWMRSGKFKPRFWIGTVISLVGAVLMSMGLMETTAPEGSLFGDGLATLAGLLGSVYLIATKRSSFICTGTRLFSGGVSVYSRYFYLSLGLYVVSTLPPTSLSLHGWCLPWH